MKNKHIPNKNNMKNKVGRPAVKITGELLKKAETFGSYGMTQDQIAAALGINMSMLYENKERFAEFTEAIAHGRACGVALASEKLMQLCDEGNKDAIKFYLSHVAGMSKRQAHLSANVDSSLTLPPTSFVINFVDGDEK